ncbi:hypothetical protein C6I20_12100 [Aeromicrobium sp. A1-2]|uniref:WbqC family protein n=1 Tax=Aeromicrobium sp. A1-2 TaxID=2107713 RepID=UPI000E534AFC|nr:WbqC family protein [Aeromicrobium sp. A1-2]AXT85853.1 hypothetical protein C6I20_12100 [Aeromicrobium sp. A1-2]
MIVASRQVDLLPSSEFWYDMAKADTFDLRIADPFQPRAPQRRVMMRGRWGSIPVVSGRNGSLVSEARILPVETCAALSDLITERYREARHWSRYGDLVLDMINQAHTELLWQLNLQLILGIRELLDITTPVSIGRVPLGVGGAGLAAVLRQYDATTFLSETVGRAYTGHDEAYEDAGIDIVWSAHRPVTADSIVSILMDYDDPMAVVLAEYPVSRSRTRQGLSA